MTYIHDFLKKYKGCIIEKKDTIFKKKVNDDIIMAYRFTSEDCNLINNITVNSEKNTISYSSMFLYIEDMFVKVKEDELKKMLLPLSLLDTYITLIIIFPKPTTDIITIKYYKISFDAQATREFLKLEDDKDNNYCCC